jgi:hypothetical protein
MPLLKAASDRLNAMLGAMRVGRLLNVSTNALGLGIQTRKGYLVH